MDRKESMKIAIKDGVEEAYKQGREDSAKIVEWIAEYQGETSPLGELFKAQAKLIAKAIRKEDK